MEDYQKRQLSHELKNAVKQRDGYRCTRDDCPSWKEKQPILNIHHVLPEKYGGTDNMSNLVTLCLPHHKAMHTDFHAYYADSEVAIKKMWLHMRRVTTKLESAVRFGKFVDYRAPLEYLTGHRRFRGGQDEVFRALSKGRDVLFVAPTGVGKSVTYQLPGLLQQHSTLVISPLKSLMKDQVEKLWRKYVPSTYVNGDLSAKEAANRIEFIAKGMMKFVYVAPERYFKSPKSKPIFQNKYGLFVVDEAHCIDKWGVHFRQEYSELGTVRSGIGAPQTIAVTASASHKTQNEIVRSLGLEKPVRIVKGFYRPNIFIRVLTGDKKALLKNTLEAFTEHDGKTVLYVASIREGNLLQGLLLKHGYEAAFYHGQLDPEDKAAIQDRFSGMRANDEIDIVIATSAFGMGIDIPNVRTVIHWNIPGNIEDYYQQIGRAGRDGKLSDAVLLYQPGDEGLPQYINRQSVSSNKSLTSEEKKQMNIRLASELKGMIGLTQTTDPWGYILAYFGDQGATSKVRIWREKVLSLLRRAVNIGTLSEIQESDRGKEG